MNTKITLIVIVAALLLTIVPAAADPAVDPGFVTVVAGFPDTSQASPDSRFHIGDTINLTGTNTGSSTTYLFLVGPNLKPNGSQIQSDYPAGAPVTEGNAATFATAAVGPNGRWSYAWDTNKTTLAPGVYTIFVVSKPHDKAHLAYSPYGTTSIILGKPQAPDTARQENYILEELVIVKPGGTVTPGTPVTVTSSVNFVLDGKETFSPYHDLVFSTMLDNPQWSYTLILDGVANERPAHRGAVLDVSGFELSFPTTINEESVRVTLQGIAPAVREGRTKEAIRISVMDSYGNVVPNSTVIREITVLPLPSTTPYEVPTTAPGMAGMP